MATLIVVATGCSTHRVGSSVAASTVGEPSSIPAGAPCTLPHFGDLIEWRHQPGKIDRAYRLSDVDLKECQPTLNNWSSGLPESPGVCYMIGWAGENLGYNIRAVPAPPLTKAMDKIGDAC